MLRTEKTNNFFAQAEKQHHPRRVRRRRVRPGSLWLVHS